MTEEEAALFWQGCPEEGRQGAERDGIESVPCTVRGSGFESGWREGLTMTPKGRRRRPPHPTVDAQRRNGSVPRDIPPERKKRPGEEARTKEFERIRF